MSDRTSAVARRPTADVPPSPPAVQAQVAKLLRAGRFAEAEALLRDTLRAAPQNVALWNLRGINHAAAACWDDAVSCFRRGLAITADEPALWNNLGKILRALKHTETAIACHRRALELDPNSASTHHHLGLTLGSANRHAEAIAAFDRAIELNPTKPIVHWDRGFRYLCIGDLTRGWPGYEMRLFTGHLPKRDLPGARWRGERYDGKRLIIVSEQGFGDAIWVARYFRQVKALGGELIIECRPELMPLIAAMKVADRVVPKADPLPEADLHIYQCSLPGLFTPSLAAIPAAPYIAAEPQRLAKFAPALGRAEGKLKVGIVWSGSTGFGGNHDRAVPLKLFLQWFDLPGVQLYSLQKGPPESELKDLAADAPIIDLSPLIGDFADTAAAIAQLDLVLMTDSAVAHLTGAMGRPVWVLLNYAPHWQWLLDRSDSPWYPSMRLFRQKSWGDWTGVFDQAAAELLRLARRGPSR